MIDIRYSIKDGAKVPSYQTNGAAGADVCAFIEKDIVLKPLERTLVPTGICVEIPDGFEIQVRSRSGLSLKQGLICLNAPGTIDSDYRGEIGVILINLSDKDVIIHNGDRIAQLVVSSYEKASFVKASSLSETERGNKGFGATGIN